MSGLPLRLPPGTRRFVRSGGDLSEQRRQWVFLWMGVIFTPVMLLVGIVSAVTEDSGQGTAIWFAATLLIFVFSVGCSLLRYSRLTLPLLCTFTVIGSSLGSYHTPGTFGPAAGLAVVIGLVSLTESAVNILFAGIVVCIAAAVPLAVSHARLPPGVDILSQVGTLAVITTLAYVGSHASSRVLDDLRDNIAENEEMARILTENLTNLEAAVGERTRSLAERTTELESTSIELDRALAEQRVLAEKLRRQSLHDELTGLVNRRGFMQALDEYAAHGGWIVMADIDHFKAINDTWGHPVGDEALAHFAEAFRDSAPAGALAARVGGEEFALLLPPSGRRDLELRLDRLLVAVRSLSVPGLQGHGMTVSLGAADMTPITSADGGNRPTGLEVLRRADHALYEAKNSGRDRHVIVPGGR